MRYANEAVQLLHILGQDIPDAFLRPALVPRLSGMLNYFLIELTRDAQRLRVRTPEKYGFDHAHLVRDIVQCYCAFAAIGVSGRDGFMRAVIDDGRCYSVANFANAIGFVNDKRTALKLPPPDVRQFAAVVDELQRLHDETAQTDIPSEDVPEKFLDPIMQYLLTDPVQLPESGEWLQRSVIEQHLLNDSKNPFNRKPLTQASSKSTTSSRASRRKRRNGGRRAPHGKRSTWRVRVG